MKSLHFREEDNVEIVVEPAAQPTPSVKALGFAVDSIQIPRGHKRACVAIESGSPIVKFGSLIGIATRSIPLGAHVHTHNVRMPTEQEYFDFSEKVRSQKLLTKHSNQILSTMGVKSAASAFERRTTFQGYQRSNGDVGVRNYFLVVASVNCSATVVKAICQSFLGRDLSEYGVDGVIPVTHSQGCAQAIGGLGYESLNKTLSGWIYHPNVVGALVIGLGCEGTTWKSIEEQAKVFQESRGAKARTDLVCDHMGIQAEGGTAKTIRAGRDKVEKLLTKIKPSVRTSCPVSSLKIALNCGGSDGFSSVTANPLLGYVSDELVSKGGSVALAEIPECHGAEAWLASRCVDSEVRTKLDQVFKWWHDYSTSHNVELNNNLAPGNIAGGITTIMEKSLGAVTKAGTSPLTDVIGYSSPLTKSGFVLMNTPGYDPASVTGLVAGGCQLVTFTTGRGSVYGCSIAPTLKIATNSELFARMSEDMDFDAGRLVNEVSMSKLAEELYEQILDAASGTYISKSEELCLGWEEFVPWAVGETL